MLDILMHIYDNIGMRTTIDIQDELLSRAKLFASACNKRLVDVVNDSLRETLERAGQRTNVSREPYQTLTYGSGGAKRGIDFDDNASVLDTMDQEHRDPHSGGFDLDKLK